ncbi:hypothetical protein GW17_00050130 [Ensete ventricosum]|nr:hypothetical protein GW17_00050130 [Ensete ventricosum]
MPMGSLIKAKLERGKRKGATAKPPIGVVGHGQATCNGDRQRPRPPTGGSRLQGKPPAARCPQGRRPTMRRPPTSAAACGHNSHGRAYRPSGHGWHRKLTGAAALGQQRPTAGRGDDDIVRANEG